MKTRRLLAAASAFAVLWMIGLVLVRPLLMLPDISALEQVAAGGGEIPVRTLSGGISHIYRSPTYGEQVRISPDEVSDELIALTLTTEDSTFFSNPGFSPSAILRAVIQNLILRRTYSGASTITQQIVRNILMPEEERFDRSISRKAREILLAALVNLRYDKETILTLYLNEIYYGRNAAGVEKAAEVYFGKHASEVTLPEAAFIAGLPQAPNYYCCDTEAGRKRQQEVLLLFARAVRGEKCIRLGSGKDPRTYCPDPEVIREYLPAGRTGAEE